MDTENAEIWVPIEGFEELYHVSDYGRVKSLNYNHTKQEHILKPSKTKKDGYLIVNLYKDGKAKIKLVHRLVAEAFIDNPNNLPEVNHINEDKTDNRVQNLCWISPIDNINYGTCIKRRAKARYKKVIQYDLDGNFIQEWESATEVQRQLGFYKSGICFCCNGKCKTAYGFKWRYKNDE